jgi:hypothetical protein
MQAIGCGAPTTFDYLENCLCRQRNHLNYLNPTLSALLSGSRLRTIPGSGEGTPSSPSSVYSKNYVSTSFTLGLALLKGKRVSVKRDRLASDNCFCSENLSRHVIFNSSDIIAQISIFKPKPDHKMSFPHFGAALSVRVPWHLGTQFRYPVRAWLFLLRNW